MTLYYLFRDRIPFFLTIIWVFRTEIKERLGGIFLDSIGQYLISVTWLMWIGCLGLLFSGGSLKSLVGFTWSYPSPLQWGFLIMVLTWRLERKGIELFDSFYLAFLTSMGGGWVYEILRGIPYWIASGFAHWNLFNWSIVKVFFIDFQVLTLLIVYWILRKDFDYQIKPSHELLSVFVLTFYLADNIEPFFHKLGIFGGNSVYSWVMRIPVMILLYVMLDCVKNEKQR